MIDLSFESRWANTVEYTEALQLQAELWRNSVDTGKGVLLGLEHPSVITLGRRGNPEVDVLAGALAPPTVAIDRGGQATIHSPGQLVIYPIMPTQPFGGLKNYLCQLVKCTKQTLAHYDCLSKEIDGAPGLYTETGKIMFMGLRIDRGVSRHGLAINVCNDLSLFKSIRSCGATDASLDRLDRYAPEVTPQQVFEQWLKQFQILTQTDFS